MTTTLKPTPGNLVVRELAVEEKTASGLYIPATAEREIGSKVVEILAINPPPDADETDYFIVGQLVIIGKWSGTEVTVGRGKDAVKQIIINESAVLAIMEEDGTADGSSS